MMGRLQGEARTLQAAREARGQSVWDCVSANIFTDLRRSIPFDAVIDYEIDADHSRNTGIERAVSVQPQPAVAGRKRIDLKVFAAGRELHTGRWSG